MIEKELFLTKQYLFSKIVLAYCEKKLFLLNEKKLLKFEAKGREVAKILRSLEQFIQTVKGQTNLFLEVSQIIQLQIRKNYWDSEICKKRLGQV